jgi:UDP:flavonoid glycosyltransferase YjiC (YdhE family)
MARIMMIGLMARGHLNPLVGVVQCLLRDGHEVFCVFIAPQGATLSEADEEALAGARTWLLSAWSPPSANEAALRGAQLDDWMTTRAIEPFPRVVPPILRAIDEWSPDVVVADSTGARPAIAAQSSGRKWAMLALTLRSVVPKTLSPMPPGIGQWMKSHGVPIRDNVDGPHSPHLNILLTLPELVGDAFDPPPNTFLVGPSMPLGKRGDEVPFDWSKVREDRPLVYVSLGTLIGQRPEIMRDILHSTSSLGVQVIASVGAMRESLGPPHDDVIITSYAPQRDVLRRASVCVTHGGHGTVMESLLFGVPMLVVPLGLDQPIQAHYVMETGLGLATTPEDVARECQPALRRLLAPRNAFRLKAQEVARAHRMTDGAANAASLIVELARGAS